MSKVRDWLSVSHIILVMMAKEAWNYLCSAGGADNQINRERMGFVEESPHGKWFNEEYLPKHHAFVAAFVDWENPATRDRLKVGRLKDAEAAFKQVYRQLYAIAKGSPTVTDDDLRAMGMPERRDPKDRTPAPVPATHPKCQVDISMLRRLKIHFRDAGSETKAKPAGVHGCELRWLVADEPVTNVRRLTHSEFNTRTPFVLAFEDDERGKTVYFALRWQNTRGKKGPFGEIQCARVP